MKALLKRLTGGGRAKEPIRDLEKQLGYRFRKRLLLEAALTHRSYRFENAGVDMDNQRMEFLGDAVLGLAAGAYFYEHYEDKDEGWLTSLRSQVTSGDALAGVARRLGIGRVLRLGRGEEQSGGRRRASALADAVEAIVGAAYLDGGMKAADAIFRRVFIPELQGIDGDVWAENPKGKLQEYSQRVLHCGPIYRLVKRDGPAHDVAFTVEAVLGGRVAGRGLGRSKQEAEKRAAHDALRNETRGSERKS